MPSEPPPEESPRRPKTLLFPVPENPIPESTDRTVEQIIERRAEPTIEIMVEGIDMTVEPNEAVVDLVVDPVIDTVMDHDPLSRPPRLDEEPTADPTAALAGETPAPPAPARRSRRTAPPSLDRPRKILPEALKTDLPESASTNIETAGDAGEIDARTIAPVGTPRDSPAPPAAPAIRAVEGVADGPATAPADGVTGGDVDAGWSLTIETAEPPASRGTEAPVQGHDALDAPDRTALGATGERPKDDESEPS